MTHTEVPPSLRGRGLGAVLAKVCPRLHVVDSSGLLFAPSLGSRLAGQSVWLVRLSLGLA